MKYFNLLFFLFLINLPLLFYGQNDSLKTKRLAIYVSPSQILFGDIPIGIEHSLTKKFSHELFLQFKCFNSVVPFYLYNKGFGGKYFLKYSIYKNKQINLSLNLGYGYRYFYFNNKLDNAPVNNADIPVASQGISSPTKYILNKKIIVNTAIIGLSFERKLASKIYIGINAFFEYGVRKQIILINDENFAAKYGINIPYILNSNNKYYTGNFILKIGYEIN